MKVCFLWSCPGVLDLKILAGVQRRATSSLSRTPESFTVRNILHQPSFSSVPSRSGQKEDHTAQYFSHDNAEATRLRDQLAEDSLEMLIQWLKEGGNVGIHGMCSARAR